MAINHQLGNGLSFSSASISSSGEILSQVEHFKLFLTESSPNSFDTRFVIPKEATGESEDTIVFHITSSGRNPLIGVGTDDPLSTLDIVDIKDTAEGFTFLIRNSRTTTKGGDPGDAAGTINFIITSGSYDKVNTSGSVGKMVSEVDAVSDKGVGGHIRFEVSDTTTANLSNDPVEVLRLVKNTSDIENVTVKVTGSLSSTEKIKAGSAIEATTYVDAGTYVDASTYLKGDSLKIGTPSDPGSGNAIIDGTLQIGGISNVSASIAAAGGGGAVATFTNGADNRIITATSTDGINGEANLTFDGSKLLVSGSGSTILEVQGSQGQLFSITDSLSGSLFAVSDISGIPILEVFSDDTVKIGTNNNEAIIVTGSTAIASGSFSGSFQGDGSNLTGVGNVSNTGTPLNNQVAVWTNSTTIEGDADFTWSGTILTIDGSTKTRLTAVANDGIGGTVNAAGEFGYGAEVWQGPGVSDTSAGKIYSLKSDGTMVLASSGSEALASGFISYATSTSSVNGMVLRGFVYVGNLGQSIGDKIYLADNGELTPTKPTTSTHFVRIVGYASANSGIIYFNPSNDYIQLA